MHKLSLSCAVALLVVTWAPPASAAPSAFLVADIETTVDARGSSSPFLQARLGDWVYFSAADALHGEELWRTDGTAAGTELVADLCPGPCGSHPRHLTAVAGRLLLSVEVELLGREPWTSDGTRAGTRALGDLCPGTCSSVDLAVGLRAVALGDAVLFVAADPAAGRELWRTDGTPGGTQRVVDLAPGPGGSDPATLTPFAGLVYFAASEPSHGRELWASDGSAAGTRLVNDFNNGAFSSGVVLLGVVGDRLLVRQTPVVGSDLWVVQSTGQLLTLGNRPCHADCGGLEAEAAGDWMLVSKTPVREGVSATLWRTDLTPYGTEQLASFPATDLTRAGDRVFFRAHGSELWVSDGTVEGTRLVLDLGRDRWGSPAGPFDITAFGDGVVFSATTANEGLEPWVSDGTGAGTHVLDLLPGPAGSLARLYDNVPVSFVELDGRLLLAASTPEAGRELWVTDGTAAGSRLLADIHRDAGSKPAGLAAWRGRLHFSASRHGLGFDPWTSDGTSAGTAPLSDLPAQAHPAIERVAFGSHLYFAWRNPPTADQLWRTDGSVAGTVPIGGNDGAAHGFTPLGARLVLLANPEDSCYDDDCSEPMVLEPGAHEVEQLAEVNPGWWDSIGYIPSRPISANAGGFTPLGSRLLFAADDGSHGQELWATDGTPAGTALFVDLCPGDCASDPRYLLRFGDGILFVTGGPPTGHQLRRTDGTAAGTTVVHTFGPTPSIAGVRELVKAGARAYFLVATAGGDELWATDGTPAGTLRVSDLAFDGTPASARRLTAVDSRLFFSVHHLSTGEELWTSDGTQLGTRMVADLAPGPAAAAPTAFYAVDGRLAFAAADAVTGVEPWISDGTAAGTYRLHDVAPGPAASSPAEFTHIGDLLFFTAADREHGRELWAVPLAVPEPNGLLGTYFGDSHLGVARLQRVDAQVDFNWRGGSPATTLPADGFSVRWSGELVPPATDSYTFYVRSDDGARLWVDGQLLIDDWGPHPSRLARGAMTLVGGHRYRLRLEYRELTGPAVLRLLWSGPGTPRQVIPSERLFAGGG